MSERRFKFELANTPDMAGDDELDGERLNAAIGLKILF
jgi:hypothetical protein